MIDDEVIECQQCGRALYSLTPAQAQIVAANPYNFIEYCRQCSQDLLKHPML